MKEELSEILTALVSFYPVTSNQQNVRQLLNKVGEELSSVGLNCDFIQNNGVHMLYTSTQKTQRPKLLLQAHVDVVPAGEAMQTAHRVGNRLIGRGTRDMLFATAGYIWLIRDLRDKLHTLDIGIMLTGDEEIGGGSTVPFLLGQGYGAGAVWLPDAGNNLDDLVVSAKGVFNFTLTVQGKPHHGSRPWEGDNAALKLVQLLSKLQAAFENNTKEQSTCTITMLNAGDSVNKGPGEASAHIDVRYDDKNSLKQIRQILDALCKEFAGKLSDIIFGDNYENEVTSPTIQEYIKTNEAITGIKVNTINTSGSSDARYFSATGIPVIMTRPKSGGSHSDMEWVDLDSFATYCQVMKEYVLKTARI